MPLNPFKRQPDPPTNEPLLKAIMFLATAETPEAKRNYYATLLKSTLLLARETSENRPVLFTGKSGEVILPVFTDYPRLRKFLPDVVEYGIMTTPDLCQVALSYEIYRININPEHGPGGMLERYELEALAQGKMPDLSGAEAPTLGEPKFVPFGSPKLPPQEVIDKMMAEARVLLNREPRVAEGYVILTKSDDGESTLTIALRFDAAASVDAKTTFSQKFVPAIEAVLGQPMHLMWLEGERYDAIRAKVEPFYTRKR